LRSRDEKALVVIGGCCCAAAVLAALVTFRMPPRYATCTTFFVGAPNRGGRRCPPRQPVFQERVKPYSASSSVTASPPLAPDTPNGVKGMEVFDNPFSCNLRARRLAERAWGVTVR
jgi:hypothetical protein